jgi:hypothetical protein
MLGVRIKSWVPSLPKLAVTDKEMASVANGSQVGRRQFFLWVKTDWL